MLVEIEREIPGTGQRAVTQQIETEDAQTELAGILSLGFARFAPGVPEWSMLRNGDRVVVGGGSALEYQNGTWVSVRVRPAGVAGHGRLFQTPRTQDERPRCVALPLGISWGRWESDYVAGGGGEMEAPSPCIRLEDIAAYMADKAARGRTFREKSESAFRYAAQFFNRFMAKKYPEFGLGHLSRVHIDQFMVWALERVAPSTAGGRLYTLRTFFEFCVLTHRMQADPTLGIEAPVVDERSAEILTEDELEEMLEHLGPRGKGARAERRAEQRLMVRLIAYAAASLNDLTNLRVDDLNPALRTVRFRGDGRISGRTVRVPTDLMRSLTDTAEGGAVDGVVFHVPRHTLYHNLINAAERVLGRKVSPEMIRASRILALMQQNVPVWEIAAFTGVRDLNRILRYLPPWDEEEPVELGAAGPLWLPRAPATYRMRFYKKTRVGRK